MPLRTAVLFAVTSALITTAAADDAIVGRAAVIDGDTIEIKGERIRFNGVDAPESWQLCQDETDRDYRCGQVAANALAEFLSRSRPTRCEFVERDRYQRFVGNCFRADGQSVSSWLVRNGHALDWPRYSKKAFAADQEQAKRRKLGMWQGLFVRPWDARADQRKPNSGS
ncbi:thermonuclease family protein [Pseudaminobacter sp. NGMCC 1.201702]|uniref:thermonuclease family protein n=1 Tax=Pseudaminobacter sp. NGMCC 1.201702 TaxID=3391825 RepID=UPI0039EF8AE4